ncbi:MAG: hypothetical protein DHS20C02_01070 [Micavibrio sp.]|nr:MAG: hypothetical protein DHS20C02_01070 [Micavibrio sp.]
MTSIVIDKDSGAVKAITARDMIGRTITLAHFGEHASHQVTEIKGRGKRSVILASSNPEWTDPGSEPQSELVDSPDIIVSAFQKAGVEPPTVI